MTAGEDAVTSVRTKGLAQADGTGYLLARVPAHDSERYYTVEARVRTGYDVHTPADAIVIHAVDPADTDHPAHLVTRPGAPLNAIAGIWRPGQAFTDASNRISVSIEARTASGYRVTIRTGSHFSEQVAVKPAAHTSRPTQTASMTARTLNGNILTVRERRTAGTGTST